MLNLESSQQISRLIDEANTAITHLLTLRESLQQLDELAGVNDVLNVLGGQGAELPPGFNLTPGAIADAVFALSLIRGDVEAAVTGDNAGRLTALNNLRLDLGVLTGSG